MHQWLSRAVMHASRSFGDMRPTDEVLDLLGGEAVCFRAYSGLK